MARPLNSWAQEPYAPRHASHYPQDERSHILRLPPPSSLVNGSQPNHSLPSGRDTASYRYNPYPEAYAAASSIHQPAHLPMSNSEPHSVFHSHARKPIDLSDRMSPTRLSIVSDRSEDFPDRTQPRQVAEDQDSSHSPRLHPPPGQMKDVVQSYRYAEAPSVRPPLSYQSRDPLHDRSRPPSTSPRQKWSQPAESRAPERMKISDLLSNEPRPEGDTSSASKAPEPTAASSTYRIRVRQQPAAARSCGFGERDRRVIDPPPIVQVFIEDPEASEEEIKMRLKHPFSVMHCTIWNEAGDQDCSAMPEDYRQQRRLMGTIVSSPFVGKDENNEDGCFFCFPDLSCRTPGSFRLRFSLVVLSPSSRPGLRIPVSAVVMSDVFTVYNAKDFPGMRASTALTKRLKEQGCLISIKKGNDKGHTREESDDDEDDDDGGSSGQRRGKKPKRS
ncbi:velvet factor-domain-containing protein [Xylariomycetidae sp. FL2044]|nr:velvet factor-domain-containing protein [Xylariomycetidae sp. FL2044]